jgi:hypothetical protein
VSVASQNTSGQTITGYRTVLYNSSGAIVSEGFTPNTFTVTVNQTYGVRAESYGSCTFTKWSDGVTSDPRSYLAAATPMTFTAIYNCGGGSTPPTPSSVTVESVNQDGAAITGYRTVLYNSAGSLLAEGFTPNTFSTTSGQAYGVRAESYGSCTFANWSDGVRSDPRTFTATSGLTVFTAVYDCSNIKVSQTDFADCIGATSCTVAVPSKVGAGDILLVFVPGYSNTTGWQAVSVKDSLGNNFTKYAGVNWQDSVPGLSDSVFYAMVTAGGASDSVTVTYSSTATHSDPVVMDVTGPSLKVYSGNAAYCATSCTRDIATAVTPVSGDYLAAAEAYGDLGETVNGGSGWTSYHTAAYFMTAEYNTDVGTASTTFPFDDQSTPLTWGDAGIVVVSSTSA